MDCVATCRPGLEPVLKVEIERLGGKSVSTGKRAVFFSIDQAGLYRVNMAIRTAIQMLVPMRTFNARNYDMLYYQSRKTNWHQYFTNDKTLRIDVNGSSSTLNNTQYVVHRVKDGIVDTFRKLSGGIRPSINKEHPDIHIIVHLEGTRVTLCLDSSGVPLFKRGYRLSHTGAPMKEDLAAGMLLLSGLDKKSSLIDPMCGSGTLLFEGWMILNDIPPNLNRDFACQHWLNYDEELFEKERQALQVQSPEKKNVRCTGCDLDEESVELARSIKTEHFPEAEIEINHTPFQEYKQVSPGALMATNPPYGVRLGSEEALPQLYDDLGEAAKRLVPGGNLAFFTTNRQAAKKVYLRPDRTLTLFNGNLEGSYYEYSVRSEQ